MTEKEIELVQKTNANTFAILSYIKAFPRSRNMDIEVDLGLSDKTVTSVLKRLTDDQIIERKMITYKIREISVLPEQNWVL